MNALRLMAGLIALVLAAAPARAAAPKVVASIQPLHSLVAGVMEGTGGPALLVAGGGSPHTYSLRPSEARALSDAEVVFWIGPAMESFLDKPLKALSGRARVVEVAALDGLTLVEGREGDDEHGGGAAPGVGAGHGTANMHLWLDPGNARLIVQAAVRALSAADPDNADVYAANGVRVLARLDALDGELRATLAPVRALPFAVFHDAYSYFARAYGLNEVGFVTVSPERSPGARHLGELRRRIAETGARCVFAEPQFAPALVATVTEGTGARASTLDPLGSDLAPGPDAYFDLMRGLARDLAACLGAGREN